MVVKTKKIYLASESKARRKLLKDLGLNFKVMPSKVKEARRDSLSYAALVKKNALAKAKDVARRVRKGIIIAADTIMVQDGKIFGKPKNIKDAHSMLKKLSKSPQWVYTGVAIIDKDKNKSRIKVSYEKTKVCMDKLSNQEIRRYFSKVSPLDKAGSFDVQARGAFFIKRIEGCFYNVVGLPLRKLYVMLKNMDIRIFIVSLFLMNILFISGCSTEYNLATKEQETYFYSADREVALGQSIAKQVEQEYKMGEDPLMQKRVEDIGKKIVAVCDRKDITYHFYVLEDDEVNAFSLPGGYVFIYKGLIDRVDNDDELAAVIAHEVTHIVARHSIKKLQAMMGYSVLRMLTLAVPQGGGVTDTADLAFTQIMVGYAREDELLADQLGARYLKLAGYNPRAMIDFLDKLEEIHKRKPPQPKSYFKTHPYVPDRIRVVKQELGEKMDFDDYINIQQKPHQ